MAGWVTGGYPGGSRQPAPGDSFAWRQQPCKLVLHTTEGMSFPDWGYNKASHVTIDPHGPSRSWRQHQPLDKPAWTLKAPVGQVSTNSMGAIQIEIIGYAASIKDLKGADLDYLLGFIRFILDQTGIPVQCSVPFTGSSSAGVNGSVRMSPAAWTAYRGILGHQHVPGNDHWDPGDLPMQAVWLPRIKGVSPAPEPEPEEKEIEMFIVEAPNRGQGLFNPGYFKSLTAEEMYVYSQILKVPVIKESDRNFDFFKSGAIDGVSASFPVEVTVDTSDLNVVATVSDEDKQDIVNGVKALKQEYV